MTLAYCAVRDAQEQVLYKRAWPEGEAGTARGFAQDRERIVQARAFRRLAGKTQVFSSSGSDHFRSRLTHTIEVSQIAREVACALDLNLDLTEALALVHDIGHPPFGHAGERALDRCMREHGLRFDHNLHALRIVEHFEDWYAAHRGLNLTLGVREGIIKHSRDYTTVEHPALAAYFLESRPPIEAQLIDLADEIAYLTADLDDGVESGLLQVGHICSEIEIMGRAFATVRTAHPDVAEKFLFHEALQLMQSELTADLIANTRRNVAAAGVTSLEGIRACTDRLAVFSPGVEAQRKQEKDYLYRTLYTSDTLQAEHDKAENVVTTLFRFYMQDPTRMPDGYIEESETEGLPRVVADYIAGMTDNYILQQFWIASKTRR